MRMGQAQEVRQRILELSTSVWAFGALSFALEAGVLDKLSTPSTAGQISHRTGIPEELVNGVLDVLVALGLGTTDEHGFVASPGLVTITSGRAKELLAADLRSTRLQTAELVERATRGTIALDGWSYSDPDLLEAQGVRSAEMVVPWVERLFPKLEGLSERLREPRARFLDVGSGVGQLTIEMCRRFPNLQAVGIDPFETSLTLARRNVAEAGFADRIELRPQRVQDLTDDRCYDLAWVPVMFMPADVAAQGLRRVRTALRPGGWAVLGTLAVEGAEIQPAVLRLVSLLYGSGRLLPEHAAAMLTAAGFENVLAPAAMPGVAGRTIVGRRPVDE
jgi:2-polyprenyl-3-methyl-5-hydroxy-6-metoxy-1,4-benzoquinol methylase